MDSGHRRSAILFWLKNSTNKAKYVAPLSHARDWGG